MTWNGSVSGTDPYIVQVLQGANELSDGMLGIVIIMMVWSIIYFANRNSPVQETMVSAAWITMIVAVLLRLLGILSDWYLGALVVASLGTLALLVQRNSNG